jgi:hypothetical protein
MSPYKYLPRRNTLLRHRLVKVRQLCRATLTACARIVQAVKGPVKKREMLTKQRRLVMRPWTVSREMIILRECDVEAVLLVFLPDTHGILGPNLDVET